MNETYKSQLNGLVEHSLIHLYLNCDESSRLITTPKRNQILVQHLKPKIKDPQYSCLKKELKRFIAIGRKLRGDLEQRLIEIKKVHEDIDQEANDVINLFDLLETLKIKLKIDSRFIHVLVNQNWTLLIENIQTQQVINHHLQNAAALSCNISYTPLHLAS